MGVFRKHRLGQNILEYAVLLGIAGLALGSVQLYVRRGIQAAIRASVDPMDGTQEDSEETDPEKGAKTSSHMNTTVGNADSSKPYTLRKRIYIGGRREIEYNKKTNNSGSSEYKSENQ